MTHLDEHPRFGGRRGKAVELSYVGISPATRVLRNCRQPGGGIMVRMRRRTFLSSLAAAAVPATRKPPNILFIMPDQWRGMDLGSMGNRQVRTPNLDRLALEGFQFRSMSANSPVCTPARSMLLTGRYCYATGTAVNDVPLRDEETSIAEILKDRGYYTGFVGKWHVQGGMREPGFVPPGPRRQGFEFWAANICSHDYFHMHYFRDDPKPIPMPGYDPKNGSRDHEESPSARSRNGLQGRQLSPRR